MSAGKFMTEVGSEQLTDALYLQTMREMLAGMREVNANLHEMRKEINDTNQRLAKIEAKPIEDYIKELATIKAELKVLQDRHLKEDGAKSLITWLKDYTPWLFALAAGAFAYVEKGPGK